MDENNQFQQPQFDQAPQQPQYDQSAQQYNQQPYEQAPQQPYGQPQFNQAQQQPYGQPQFNQAQQQPYGQPQFNQAQQQPYGQAPQPPKKKSGMGIVIAIIAIIGGLILATVVVFVLVFFAAAKKAGDELDEFSTSSEYELMTEYINDLTTEYPSSTTDTGTFTEDTFANRNWMEQHDSSYLVPMSGNTFYYYKDKDDQTNYYYTGHYELYIGQDAYDKLTSSEYEQYGIEASELDDMISMNEQYEKDNLVLLVINNETQIVDGVDTFNGKTVTTPYYGFYVAKDGKEILDLTNMNQATYYTFEAE